MKTIFPQHYRPSEKEFSALLENCIFIFDANMLLNLYRYPPKARDDLLKILRKLSQLDRLWLPFQSAFEFQENRIVVIADQKRKYGQVKEVITDIQNDLQKKLDKLQLRKRHSSIDPDILIKEINLAFEKYTKQLDSLESEQIDVYQDDKIRAEIDKIFDEKIGAHFSQSELDNIFTEGSNRYKAKRPPGFADEQEKKGSYSFYGSLVIKREFGDLIVWKEILKFISERKPDGVIFVTDDNKDDWWLELSGKTIGPRPELLSELYSQTGFSNFYIYNSERFMEITRKHFKIRVEQESIEQVKIISENSRRNIQSKVIRKLFDLYDHKCQVCGFSDAVEITHIMPRYIGGVDIAGNLLVVCPNHHRLFDKGAFSVDERYQLLGIDGVLTVHASHDLSDSLKYHREHIYKGAKQELSLRLF